MICPYCHEEIDYVVVRSEGWQKGFLEGNRINNYGTVEEMYSTIDIECPKCQHSLMSDVIED